MNRDQAADQAIALLRSSDTGTRERAVEALGLIGSQRGAEAVANSLLDPESRVRQRAAWALRQLGYDDTTLRDFFDENRDILIQKLQSQDEVQLLEKIALGEKQPPPSSKPPREVPMPMPAPLAPWEE